MTITFQQSDREPGDLSGLARAIARRTEREQAAATQAKERADATRDERRAFIRQLTGKNTDQTTSTTDTKEN